MDERRSCGCVIPGIESPVRCAAHDGTNEIVVCDPEGREVALIRDSLEAAWAIWMREQLRRGATGA